MLLDIQSRAMEIIYEMGWARRAQMEKMEKIEKVAAFDGLLGREMN